MTDENQTPIATRLDTSGMANGLAKALSVLWQIDKIPGIYSFAVGISDPSKAPPGTVVAEYRVPSGHNGMAAFSRETVFESVVSNAVSQRS